MSRIVPSRTCARENMPPPFQQVSSAESSDACPAREKQPKNQDTGGKRDRPNVITDNESVGRKRLPLKRASAHDKPKTWRAKKRCGTADGHVVGVTTSSGLFAHHGVLESLPAVAVTWVCTVVTPFDSMLHQEKLTAWCPRKGVTLTKSVQWLPRHSRVPCRLR